MRGARHEACCLDRPGRTRPIHHRRAFNPFTGEVVTRNFASSPAEVSDWVLSFERPKAVYETGVTGFHLVRELRALGVDCAVDAVSKMHKPAADRRRKGNRADAALMAAATSDPAEPSGTEISTPFRRTAMAVLSWAGELCTAWFAFAIAEPTDASAATASVMEAARSALETSI